MMMGVRCGCAEERRRPSSNAVWAACPAACASEPQNGSTVRPVNGTSLVLRPTSLANQPIGFSDGLLPAESHLAPGRRPPEDNTTPARFNKKSPTFDTLSMYFKLIGGSIGGCAEECVGRLANTNRIPAPWRFHS